MQYPLFYNSVNQDRVYDADSFSDWLKKFFTTGVFKDEMQVTAAGGMYVQVGGGYVNVGGKVMQFDQSTLTVGTADSRYYRIDSVIVERNDTDRQFYLKIVPGGTGTESSVTGVTPTRSGGIYQLVLARIKVKPGATYITQQDITDTRADSTLCGIVAGTVTQMDFDQFSAQFADYFDNFRTGNEQDFRTWFATIQDVLDGDTAGNLMNEINSTATTLRGEIGESAATLTADIDKCVQMDESYLNLDTTAESGTDDGDLYASIVALDWETEVIEETQLILKKLFTKILRRTAFKLTQLYNTRTEATKVGTVWEYHTHDFLADWNMIAIQFVVHEHVEVFYIVRGDTLERGLTDWPNAGKFRGSIYVDWVNGRIGIRAISAGTSRSNYNLIYYSTIYGIVPK